jgi:hypothetical protein
LCHSSTLENNNVFYYINSLKEKNMKISADTENAVSKIAFYD